MEREPTSLIDASGLGLLPGVAIALTIGLAIIALVLIVGSWWVVPVVALGVVGLTAVVVAVVLAVLEDDEEEGRLRRHVPGL